MGMKKVKGGRGRGQNRNSSTLTQPYHLVSSLQGQGERIREEGEEWKRGERVGYAIGEADDTRKRSQGVKRKSVRKGERP